jgi:hypothetical protein
MNCKRGHQNRTKPETGACQRDIVFAKTSSRAAITVEEQSINDDQRVLLDLSPIDSGSRSSLGSRANVIVYQIPAVLRRVRIEFTFGHLLSVAPQTPVHDPNEREDLPS